MNPAIQELKAEKEALVTQFCDGKISAGFPARYAGIMDQYFRRSLEESESGRDLFRKRHPFALLAVGGYGREGLCLHSDIDVVILFGNRIPAGAKGLVDELLLPLWDLGLDLGYGVRSIKDCLRLSADDFEVLTSLMDMRFVCGDSPLYLTLAERLHAKVISRKSQALSDWLRACYEARLKNFGDASYLLEPNLKDGIGGLRDYHYMLWLANAFFHLRVPRDFEYLGLLSHDEFEELQRALDFIHVTRSHLHRLSRRKNDRMGFDYQEEIARSLGFQNEKGLMAVERFLGKLHECISCIKTLHQSFVGTYSPQKPVRKKADQADPISAGLHRFRGKINFDTATDILKNPLLLVEIFEKSAHLGLPLALEARRLVKEFSFLVDDTLRGSAEAVALFLAALKGKKNVEVLDEMFETGFLDVFLPEFGAIKYRVQFDAYHSYPVGRHSLETVKNLKKTEGQSDLLLPFILSECRNPEPLLLAALLHDIGKVGEDHARRGVQIASRVLDRFGYDEAKGRDVLFLVENHLLLAETATRRDLNDEKMVVQCARLIGDEARLRMLYLLTWADSNATGPRAWNDWIANLVRELFFKILHILQKKELATPDATVRVQRTRTLVRRHLADEMREQELDALFEVMPPRYLLAVQPADMIRHAGWLKQIQDGLKEGAPIAFRLEAEQEETEACWKLTFMAQDRPGLFSDLAGVFALNDINILSAEIYTWRNGIAVDFFRVSGPLDDMHPEETWERVRQNLRDTLTGRLSLGYRLRQKAKPAIPLGPVKPRRPPEVIVDNTSSDFFTLVEVFADDRVGLLYDITRTLFDLKLDIRIAKIATKADQSADVFYVRDLEGQKVEDEIQVREVREAIIHQLTG